MRKVQFANGEWYHIYNRGVEKRKIFMGPKDYERFKLGMREFNGEERTELRSFAETSTEAKPPRKSRQAKQKQTNPLVELICFTLMPNHFHFILRQLVEGGISAFMHKLGGGYTMYFNTKYERTGSLLQGPFGAIHIMGNTYLLHLSRYIHLNIIELIQPDWKEKGIMNKEGARVFLRSYPYSSYHSYLGKAGSGIELKNDIILDQFETSKDYEDFVLEWLVKDLKFLGSLVEE